MIGGGDWGEDRLVPDIMRAALAGEPVRVRNPNSIRPWQHVLNPLSGYLVLAQALWDSPEHARGWNFGPARRGCPPGRLDRASASASCGPGSCAGRSTTVRIRTRRTTSSSTPPARARASAGVRWWALEATLQSIVEWYRALRRRGGHARGHARADRRAHRSPAMTLSPGGPSEAAGSSRDVLDTPAAGPAALRGGALRSGAYMVGILLSLLSAPLLIRHLHRIEYGRFITVTALVTIVGGLSEGGLNAVALREYASHSGVERDRLMANLLGIRMLLSAIGVAGAVGFAVVAGYGRVMVIGALLAGIGMTLQVTQDLIDTSLQATMRFGKVTLVEFLRQFVSVALIVALVVFGSHLLGFFVVTIPAGVIALALSVRLVRGLFPLRPTLHLDVVWPLLRDTFSLAIAIALNSAYFRITVVIMSLAATAEQTAYFAISLRVVEVLIGVPVLVMGAAYPILTRAQRDDEDRFDHAARRMFELAVLVGVWLALCLQLGAGFVVEVLAEPAAHPAAAVLRLQGVAVMFTFVTVSCTYPLLSMRRFRLLLLGNGLGLLATFVTALALVPSLAARGAAIATVVAELTLALVVVAGLMRARPRLRLPFTVLPVAVLAGAAGFGAGALVGVHPLVEVLIATVVYITVVALMGRFPPELGHATSGLRARASARVSRL